MRADAGGGAPRRGFVVAVLFAGRLEELTGESTSAIGLRVRKQRSLIYDRASPSHLRSLAGPAGPLYSPRVPGDVSCGGV